MENKTDTNKELMNEYFCDAIPKEVAPIKNKIMQKFYNWAQANSLWILAFGTGCGSIELYPLYTARYDISRFGIAPRATPRQASLFIVSGYASIKTIKRKGNQLKKLQNCL